jgi:hypothetical protein
MTPEEAKVWFIEHREEAQTAFDAIGVLLRSGDIEALVDFTTNQDEINQRAQAAVQRRVEPPFDGNPCPACPSIFRNLHAVAHNADEAFFAAGIGQGGWERAYRKMKELRQVVEEYQPLVDKHFEDGRHSHGWMQ